MPAFPHRDTNHAVTFVTGHDTGGAVPASLDWAAIAKGSPVIVIYMALTHLEDIAATLLAAGRKPDEPAAIVSHASQPAQQVLETTIAMMAQDAAAAGCETPALLVIGPVVGLRPGLDWLHT
jgi:uroporphyrin-III C-methyltransferase